jgi:hypothetical protein
LLVCRFLPDAFATQSYSFLSLITGTFSLIFVNCSDKGQLS